MKFKYEKSPKTTSSVAPTTLNLQTRPFAPIEAASTESPSTEKTEKSEYQQKHSPNILERLINSPTPEPASSVQRKPENRLKAIARNRLIQAKLAIGEPNDKYEKEADDTASKVVQQINTPIQNQSIQRDALPQGNKLRKKPLQRRENVGGGDASTELETSIQSARGGGQPLAADLQRSMGQAMGADFSGVKVHTDSQSDQLNQSIQAKAFTTGQDVFFRQGAYEPSSRGGQELIAHELTHVVQQNGGAVQRSPLKNTDEITTANNIQSSPSTGQIIQPKVVDEKAQLVKNFDELHQTPLFVANEELYAKALSDKNIQYALSPDNNMFFTLKNIEDYLQGKKVPGLSTLVAGDILAANADVGELGGSDVSKEQERAVAILESLKRMTENRNEQSEKEKNVAADSSSDDESIQYEDESTNILAEQFKKSTFYYGTTGEQGKGVWKNIFGKVKKAKEKRLGANAGNYVAGNRNIAFINKLGGTEDHQMMDMYYGGQEFEAWQMMRNPIIGEYIHKMMGYAGEYDQTESPDTTFRKNYPLGGAGDWDNRGWSKNSMPKNNPKMKQSPGTPSEWAEDMSATMEISRIIREGVKKWGGKIVMEHKNVCWGNIFGARDRYGDTDKEIESFMDVFLEQRSSNCKWGKGELIYTYGGTPEAITKSRVRTDYWYGGPDPDPTKNRPEITEANQDALIMNKRDWYDALPDGADQLMLSATKKKEVAGLTPERIAFIEHKIAKSKAEVEKLKSENPDNWQELRFSKSSIILEALEKNKGADPEKEAAVLEIVDQVLEAQDESTVNYLLSEARKLMQGFLDWIGW